MAVNCAVLSYDGNIHFGFSGDVHAAPDLRRFESLLQESFVELRDAAGITPPRVRAQKRSKKDNRPTQRRKRSKAVARPVPGNGISDVVTLPPPSVLPEQQPNPAIDEEKVHAQMTA
jgi:hypothetical protein